MKKALTSGIVLLLSIQVAAQCDGQRFFQKVFPQEPIVTKDISFGKNKEASGKEVTLTLDVYRPAGDTLSLRPLVIIAHGGSFLFGNKNGPDAVPLAKDLAKMGYVSASINYRLGMTNLPTGSHTLDSTDVMPAVIRGMHDGRAAVRFFRKDVAENGNTYGVDTSAIYFAGVSAGGFIALHLAYLDQPEEFPDYIDTSGVSNGHLTGQPGMRGGIEGNSGNPSYSSKVKAVINVSGALVDTSWMKIRDIPVLNFHGTNDQTVPYGTAMIDVLSLFPIFKVNGSASVARQAEKLEIKHCMVTWQGAGHVPEVGITQSALAYYDSMLQITRNFLYHFTCGAKLNCTYTTTLAALSKFEGLVPVKLYPNPARQSLFVALEGKPDQAFQLTLLNLMGQTLWQGSASGQTTLEINRNHIPGGLYVLQIKDAENLYSTKVIFQ